MKKALILSDSHKAVDRMRAVTEKENPDIIIHLGDHLSDAVKLKSEYPDIEMYYVLGNTDSQNDDEEWIKRVEICGWRILLTHGNPTFLNDSNLNEDLSEIFGKDGRCDDADIILFGHIHAPYLTYRYDKWIMCPGHIGRSSRYNVPPTYGVMKISTEKIHWKIIEIDDD